MKQLLMRATRAAFQSLKPHVKLVGLANVNESTFRSFFLAGLMGRCPKACCQTEWHKFDLLVQRDDENALVEFKFNVVRQTRELDGHLGYWKGGASAKNESEFKACVHKLHTLKDAKIKHRYVLLVYAKGYPKRSKCSFTKSYDALPARPEFRKITDVAHCMADKLSCKIIEVACQASERGDSAQ
jgi:hypothetical protein